MTELEQKPIIHKEYPPIFSKDKSGKTRIWKATVFAFPLSNTAMSVINHGINEGKLQVDTRQYTEGKNIGKKNETTPLEQCVSEVDKKRKDKMEKEGYAEILLPNAINSAEEDQKEQGEQGEWTDAQPHRKIFPMLANKY